MKKRTKPPKEQISTVLALEIFSSDAYLTINKRLLQTFGPGPAVFLGNLIDKYKYFQGRELLENDQFYLTHEDQMKQTGIQNEKAIRRYKKVFIENGIIQVKRSGQPAKEYYLINFEKLLSTTHPDLPKRAGLDPPKRAGLYIRSKENKLKEKKVYKEKWIWEDYLSKDWIEDKELLPQLKAFQAHRQEMGKPLTALAAKKIINKLTKYPNKAKLALQHAIENNWTGVFPESIKDSELPTKYQSARDMLLPLLGTEFFSQYFNSITRLMRINEDPLAQSELASRMMSLVGWYRRESLKPATAFGLLETQAERWDEVPTSKQLLQEYSKWLEAQDWLKNLSPSAFSSTSKIFQRWRKEYERNIGVDIISGKKVV